MDQFTLRTGITDKDFRQLTRIPLFAGLKKKDLRSLLSTSSVRRYPNHTTLFMEGDSAEHSYIVMGGWVKLYRSCENGQEVVISVISPGEGFAEDAIFDRHTYPVNAVAVSDARLLVVRADSLLQKLGENSALVLNMLAAMSRHLRSNIDLVHQLSSMSSAERLADFLVGLTDSDQGQAVITLPLDKSLIAARLGMQPETFSRALAKLKSTGVSNSGHDVFINDVAALKAAITHNSFGCP